MHGIQIIRASATSTVGTLFVTSVVKKSSSFLWLLQSYKSFPIKRIFWLVIKCEFASMTQLLLLPRLFFSFLIMTFFEKSRRLTALGRLNKDESFLVNIGSSVCKRPKKARPTVRKEGGRSIFVRQKKNAQIWPSIFVTDKSKSWQKKVPPD